jgi:hypothetical protein
MVIGESKDRGPLIQQILIFSPVVRSVPKNKKNLEWLWLVCELFVLNYFCPESGSKTKYETGIFFSPLLVFRKKHHAVAVC